MSLSFSRAVAACAEGTPTPLHKLMCRMPERPEQWLTLLHAVWPYLLAVAALALAARWAWLVLARRTWSRLAASAAWLEVTPPVSASPSTTVELWRLLARQLDAPGRFTLRPKRIAFEVFAQGDRMRVGFLVPPGINPLTVSQRVQQAWPGARLTNTTAPSLPSGGDLAGVRLVPSEPDCLDYITEPGGRGLDPLRAVYDSMASGGRQGGALIQVLVQRAPRHRTRMFTVAVTDPARLRRNGSGRFVDYAVRGLSSLLLGAINLFSSNHSGTHTPRRPTALETERAARVNTKRQAAPHFLLGVRVFAVGENARAARTSARHIAAGFDLIAPRLGVRLLRRPAEAAVTRWAASGQMVLSSVNETAALATVPAEPPAYGLPGAASRRRAGTADAWRPTAEPDHADGEDDQQDPWRMA